jgi:hypothetical protein
MQIHRNVTRSTRMILFEALAWLALGATLACARMMIKPVTDGHMAVVGLGAFAAFIGGLGHSFVRSASGGIQIATLVTAAGLATGTLAVWALLEPRVVPDSP